MKRILSLLLIVTTIFTLTGCGSNRDISVDMQLAAITTENGGEAKLTSKTSATFGDTNAYSTSFIALNSYGNNGLLFSNNSITESDDSQMTFEFHYNGAVPINITKEEIKENGETDIVDTTETVSLNSILLSEEDLSTSEDMKVAYTIDTTNMYVNYVSYTTIVFDSNGNLVTEMDNFLGAPFRYGMNTGIKLPDIEAEYDNSLGVFIFKITHEKLQAKISDLYSTKVIINSIDISLTLDNNDGDYVTYGLSDEDINIWDSKNVSETFIGKINSNDFDTYDKYVGAICLRNNGESFEFISPATSLQDSYNQYSFLKYDGINTITIDDTHLDGNKDRYLATYSTVQEQIGKIDLREEFNLLEDLFKMSFKIEDEKGTVTDVSYFYNIEKETLYIYTDGHTYTDSWSLEFDGDYTKLSILAWGCNIVNTSYSLQSGDFKGGIDLHFFTEQCGTQLNINLFMSDDSDPKLNIYKDILIVVDANDEFGVADISIWFDGFGEIYEDKDGGTSINDGIFYNMNSVSIDNFKSYINHLQSIIK